MNVGSLFSGIGGFDLGLERAGMRTVWFCEQDQFCRRVLAEHWPGVPIYPDVTELRGADLEPVDVLCGGFPCQDLSVAGKGAGIDGARSGLWSEFARLIGELRPRYVLVENVTALLGRGLGRVLGDLSTLGYDAEWDCLPASAFGAPHRRDRIWIVAYPSGEGRREIPGGTHGDEAADAWRRAEDDHVAVGAGPERLSAGGRDRGLADPHRVGREERVLNPAGISARPGDSQRSSAQPDGLSPCGCDWDYVDHGGFCACCHAHIDDPRGLYASQPRRKRRLRGCPCHVADPNQERRDGRPGEPGSARGDEPADSGRGELPDPDGSALQPWRVGGGAAQASGSEWWAAEPPVGRVAHGVPNRLDQLAALGNALVPQIPEWIGHRLMAAAGEKRFAECNGGGFVKGFGLFGVSIRAGEYQGAERSRRRWAPTGRRRA